MRDLARCDFAHWTKRLERETPEGPSRRLSHALSSDQLKMNSHLSDQGSSDRGELQEAAIPK